MVNKYNPSGSSSLTISVIVPVVDEASRLARTLASVGAGGEQDGIEIIVVDGGSGDGSDVVAAQAGVRVIASPVRQRAAQMNLGAREAHGSMLLFLHADTSLPSGWREAVCDGLERTPGCVGGAFRRRFDSDSRVLHTTCWLADLRGRWFGWFLGDQAMFVWRDVFESLGGFASLQPFEDLEFSLRLARAGRTCLLDAVVISSGRRFAPKGALRQTLDDFALTMRFLKSPQRFVARAAVPHLTPTASFGPPSVETPVIHRCPAGGGDGESTLARGDSGGA